MKHVLSIWIVVIILATTGCGPRQIDPKFEYIEIDTILSQHTTQYEVRYTFATITNSDTSESLRAIELSNIGYFFGLEEFNGTVNQAIAASLEDIDNDTQNEANEPGLFSENSETIVSEASVVDTLLVYKITSSQYKYGAHSKYNIAVHNYSIEGGYEITLGDLFNTEQQKALDFEIHQKLYDRFGVNSDEELAEQGFFPEFIGTCENFAATHDGITFYFNPYQIGCYTLGLIEVTISKAELEVLSK